jgi:hypothetical protein
MAQTYPAGPDPITITSYDAVIFIFLCKVSSEL